ncbi:DUF5979 domain-containing protein [Corynebacterium flavescens]|uniref:DUF5979 domain-containing protein n=1 Tax=Corynebacterium flavescens TaxID=28028 RepID=UPI003FD08B2B
MLSAVAAVAMILALVVVFPSSASAQEVGGRNNSAGVTPTVQPNDNPLMPEKCGLRIALAFDLSNSIGSDGLIKTKEAGIAVVNGLVGTSTSIGVYNFASNAPANGNKNLSATKVVDTQGANTVKEAINGLKMPPRNLGGTNWDRAFASIPQHDYDVVYFITDGKPTQYSDPVKGPGNAADQSTVDKAIESANSLKASGTRVVPLGVGDAVNDAEASKYLEYISGQGDAIAVSNYAALVTKLRDEVTKYCRGDIEILKQVVDKDGNVKVPAAAGWNFKADLVSGDIKLEDPTSATTGNDGKVQFGFKTSTDTGQGNVKISETPKDGYTFAEAKCTDSDGGNLEVKDVTDSSFSIPVKTGDKANCVVKNRELPSGLTIEKTINGDDASHAAPGVEVEPGSDLDVVYKVTNTGEVALKNVSVSDRILQPAESGVTGISPESVESLAPGASVDFKVTIKAPEAFDAQHENAAKAKGTPPVGPDVVTPEDPAYAHTPKSGSLSVSKALDGITKDAFPAGTTFDVTASWKQDGQNRTHKFELNPNGDAQGLDDLPNGTVVTFSENDAPEVDGYKFEGVKFTPEEVTIEAGKKVEVSATNKYSPLPSGLTIEKTINGDDASHAAPGVEVEPGSDLDVVYKVTNTGEVALKNVSVSDRILQPAESGVTGISPESVESLAPGASVDFKVTIKAPEAFDAQHENAAKAKGTPPVGPDVVTPEDPAYAHTPKSGSLSVSKALDGITKDAFPAGTTFDVTASWKQDGQNRTHKFELNPNGDAQGLDDLPNGTVVTFSENDAPEVDGYKFEGVKFTPEEVTIEAGKKVEVSATNKYSPLPSGLTIEKTINGDDASHAAPGVEVEPGSDLDVVYKVTNTGEVALKNVSVSDRILQPAESGVTGISPESVESLAPGASVDFKVTIKAPEAFDAQHENAAKAKGTPPVGPDVVTPEDPAYAHTPSALGFTFAKSLHYDAPLLEGDWNDKEFTFNYVCGEGASQKDGTFSLTPGTENVVTAIGNLKEGTICKITEEDASVDGFDLTTSWNIVGGEIIQTSGEFNEVLEFKVGPQDSGKPLGIAVDNTYKVQLGEFTINKIVAGEAAGAAQSRDFEFDYSCTVGEEVVKSGSATVNGAGSAVVKDVPLLSTCVVTERNATVPDTTVQSQIEPSEGFSLWDAAEHTVEVNVTNTYTYVDGGFVISKFVEGNAVSFAPDSFTVNYRCEPPKYSDEDEGGLVEEDSVTLKAGESQTIDNIAPGSTCKVWEDDAPAKDRIGIFGSSTNAPGASWDVGYEIDGRQVEPAEFEVKAAGSTQVSVTNTYNKEGKNGLVIIPLPIGFPGGGSSFPPTDGGSSVPPSGGGSSLPPTDGGSSVPPSDGGSVVTPTVPASPELPNNADSSNDSTGKGQSGQPSQKSVSKGLAATGANVIWIAGGALLLLVGGAWLLLRARKNEV